LIEELNQLFTDSSRQISGNNQQRFSDEEADQSVIDELQQKLLDKDTDIADLLTPWSHSLFNSLPDFMKQQLLIEHQLSGSIKLSQIETEKLVAFLVNEELKKRKRQGTYKGSFGPVTHFFGYQGRSGHPSMFDCSLGSTMGYCAAALVQHKITGACVTVNNVTAPPSTWRCGAVPLIGLVGDKPRSEFPRTHLNVPSDHVDLTAKTFQLQKTQSKNWRVNDRYTNPGPIQFYLDEADENNKIPVTLTQMFQESDEMTEQIRGLCQSLKGDCIFTEHQHLLYAALSSLKSAKLVLNSHSELH